MTNQPMTPQPKVPMTAAQAARYLADLVNMRGNGLPPGRTKRLTECAHLLDQLDRVLAERAEIEHVVHVANYHDGEAWDDKSLADMITDLAADAGRPTETAKAEDQ